MWTSCFEATSCQDESATEAISGQALEESSACADEKHWPEGHSQERDSQTPQRASPVTSSSTIQGQGFPKHCRTHPLPCMLGKKRDSRVEGVYEMFGLHRSI